MSVVASWACHIPPLVKIWINGNVVEHGEEDLAPFLLQGFRGNTNKNGKRTNEMVVRYCENLVRHLCLSKEMTGVQRT